MATLNVTNLKHASSSSNNIVLNADGSSTINSLSLPGHVIQVVTASTNSGVSEGNGTYVDSNLSASITLTSSNNKVLVLVDQSMRIANTAAAGGGVRLLRGSTVIADGDPRDSTGPAMYYFTQYAGNISHYFRHNTHKLDTPGAGTHTYKTQIRVYGASNSSLIIAQPGLANSSGESNITLLEIAV
tara:strand:- start:340 stop:897 length:558 start_codon:yes stop_codon:yes gene_type:complete